MVYLCVFVVKQVLRDSFIGEKSKTCMVSDFIVEIFVLIGVAENKFR